MQTIQTLLVDPTFWLAVYGAVVSTILALLHVRAHRRDNGAFRLSGDVWQLPGDTEPTTKVSIANVGRRVIEFDEFGVVKKGGERGELWHLAVERRLMEAQSVVTEPSDFNEMFDPAVRTVYVRDTRGRVWKMPPREFRRFRAAHEKAWRDRSRKSEGPRAETPRRITG